MSTCFPVLTYHAINVIENCYAQNDLIAFAQDLRVLATEGWRIAPLGEALRILQQGQLPTRTVALTADDGSILDYEDFDHPNCGPQRSLFQLLVEFRSELPNDTPHRPHVTSFVIASPQARAELDRKEFLGLNVWHDDWWAPATRSGLMAIESHSWDHNHAALERTVQRDNRRGDFGWIDTEEDCRNEIEPASDYIAAKTQRRPEFFAYPYGQASSYLRGEFLPRFGATLGLRAAWSTDPEPVTPESDRWHLPRFVCGRDWTSPNGLVELLRSI